MEDGGEHDRDGVLLLVAAPICDGAARTRCPSSVRGTLLGASSCPCPPANAAPMALDGDARELRVLALSQSAQLGCLDVGHAVQALVGGGVGQCEAAETDSTAGPRAVPCRGDDDTSRRARGGGVLGLGLIASSVFRRTALLSRRSMERTTGAARCCCAPPTRLDYRRGPTKFVELTPIVVVVNKLLFDINFERTC